MQRVTLKGLPITETTRSTLLGNTSVAGALVSDDPSEGRISIVVWGPGLQHTSLEQALKAAPGAAWCWERDKPVREAAPGRTQAALRLLDEDPDLTPYAAAGLAGVNVSAVYRALARREAKAAAPKCQCCGRPLHATLAVAA